MVDKTSMIWTPVEPQGPAVTLIVIIVVFSSLSIFTVALRTYARYTTRLFGTEDWLMCISLVFNLAQNGVAVWGTTTGIGAQNTHLTAAQLSRGGRCIIIWQFLYICGLNFTKSSICASLERIASQKRYTIILRILIALMTMAAIATFVVYIKALITCDVSWGGLNENRELCFRASAVLILTVIFSAVNILTDLTVAILPIFLVWNVQMPRKLKVTAAIVLGLGLLASIATIARLPYVTAVATTPSAAGKGTLYIAAYIMMWSAIECDLGMIAGSLPMALKLIPKLSAKVRSSRTQRKPDSTGMDLVTIGRVKESQILRLNNAKYEAEIEVNIISSSGLGGRRSSGNLSDGARIEDSSSTRQMILVTRCVEQTSHVAESSGPS